MVVVDQDQGVFLTIEKGQSNLVNSTIKLPQKEILIGRKCSNVEPDIIFNSLYISRRHAFISFENNRYFLTDCDSKHGTQINKLDLAPRKPYLLKDGNFISFAKGEAILKFHNTYERELESTLDFPNLNECVLNNYTELMVNIERREIMLDGTLLYLSGKDIELFLLLYQKVNQAVGYEEIKAKIWPERISKKTGMLPDVGSEEINALVYRLRKKLGKQGNRITTIPRYGYMLDLKNS